MLEKKIRKYYLLELVIPTLTKGSFNIWFSCKNYKKVPNLDRYPRYLQFMAHSHIADLCDLQCNRSAMSLALTEVTRIYAVQPVQLFSTSLPIVNLSLKHHLKGELRPIRMQIAISITSSI